MLSLAEVRSPLLSLHKSLVDAERREFERLRGRLENAEFLKVLMEDPQFAWLQPLTALIVRLDEALEDHQDGAAAIDELRRLLAPDEHGSTFQQRYAGVLQRSPDVVVDHGRTVRALAEWRGVRDSNPRALAG
jgi:hypothetical protein